MTKKDYELIAGAINTQRYELGSDTREGYQTLKELSLVLAGQLERDNPRFDRDRFIKACGIER